MASLPPRSFHQTREFRLGQIGIQARHALEAIGGRILEAGERPEWNEDAAQLVCHPFSKPLTATRRNDFETNPDLIYRVPVALPQELSDAKRNRLAMEICYPLSWMRKAEIKLF